MKVNWVWCDLEMTGLDPRKNVIIEIATIITDDQLNVVAEGPSYVVHQSDEHLEGLDPWIVEHHGKSGLLEAVKSSHISQDQAELDTLAFIKQHTQAGKSPLCGNSIGTDRLFLAQHMPSVAKHLHYRNIDVSSFKIVMDAWGLLTQPFKKKNTHRALDDIKESIAELRFYKKFIKE